MDIKIVPSTLKGDIKIPSSKSVTHRMLISACPMAFHIFQV